jgi:hypothetical protein
MEGGRVPRTTYCEPLRVRCRDERGEGEESEIFLPDGQARGQLMKLPPRQWQPEVTGELGEGAKTGWREEEELQQQGTSRCSLWAGQCITKLVTSSVLINDQRISNYDFLRSHGDVTLSMLLRRFLTNASMPLLAWKLPAKLNPFHATKGISHQCKHAYVSMDTLC